MKLFQPFSDDGNVARADLEKAVAAEGTAAATLKVMGLRLGHLAEESVGPL
jgi:hypothetical protein